MGDLGWKDTFYGGTELSDGEEDEGFDSDWAEEDGGSALGDASAAESDEEEEEDGADEVEDVCEVGESEGGEQSCLGGVESDGESFARPKQPEVGRKAGREDSTMQDVQTEDSAMFSSATATPPPPPPPAPPTPQVTTTTSHPPSPSFITPDALAHDSSTPGPAAPPKDATPSTPQHPVSPNSLSPSAPPPASTTTPSKAVDLKRSTLNAALKATQAHGPLAGKALLRALLEGVSAAEETRRYEEEHFEVGLGKPGGLRELAEESRARMWEQRRGQVEQNQKGDEQEDVIPAIGPTKVTLDENGDPTPSHKNARLLFRDGALYEVAPNVKERLYIQRPETTSSILTEIAEISNEDCCLSLVLSPCARSLALSGLVVANWPFFEQGGTMVIITSISELSQGAQSQVETWSEIIAEQTSGRLAIIFIDKLEDLQNYHIKSVLLVRYSDAQVVDLSTTGNLTVNGIGSEAVFSDTPESAPRSVESLKITCHERWNDGTGSGEEVLSTYDEMLVNLRDMGKMVWAVPALERRGKDIDFERLLSLEVFKITQTGLNDMFSEKTYAARQQSDRILQAAKASAPSKLAHSTVASSSTSTAASPPRRKQQIAVLKTFRSTFKKNKPTMTAEAAQAAKKLQEERASARKRAAQLVQNEYPDLFSATVRRKQKNGPSKPKSTKTGIRTLMSRTPCIAPGCEVVLSKPEYLSSHLYSKHATLLNDEEFLNSLDPATKAQWLSACDDNRLHCRYCDSTYAQLTGLVSHLTTQHRKSVEADIDSFDIDVRRLLRNDLEESAWRKCPFDASHTRVYTSWSGVTKHIQDKHLDDLAALTPFERQALPAGLVKSLGSVGSRSKGKSKAAPTGASEKGAMPCPDSSCKAKPYKGVVALALHLLSQHHKDKTLLESVSAELKQHMKANKDAVSACKVCDKPHRYTNRQAHMVKEHDDNLTEDFMRKFKDPYLRGAVLKERERVRAAASSGSKQRKGGRKKRAQDSDTEDEYSGESSD